MLILALGRCVKHVLNGAVTYYVYDGAHPIMEYEATHGTEVGNWVYGRGIDEVLARSNNGQGQYFLQDRLGNTSAIIGGAEGGPGFTGKVLEFYRYDAFGVARFFHFDENNVAMETPKTVINNRFLFTGREYQEKFGFYEFRARAYNPTIGRFMSEDPKGYDAGDYNLYRYVGNDPLDETDPMGLVASGPWERLHASAFNSQLLEGPGTPGAAVAISMALISAHGANSGIRIPQEQYATFSKAGEAANEKVYPQAKREEFARELNHPIAQVNGARSGHYIYGELVPGFGLIPAGKAHAGDQGSALGDLSAHIPLGTHLVGYATVHRHYDPGKVKRVDVPAFEKGYGIPARIQLLGPYNFNVDKPRSATISGNCEYCQ